MSAFVKLQKATLDEASNTTSGARNVSCCRCKSPDHLSSPCNSCAESLSGFREFPNTGVDLAGIPGAARDVVTNAGMPLDPGIAASFGSRFKYDLGRVRVHTGAKAARSASTFGATAYTVANHVVFDVGRYAPKSVAGKQLIAHELAHVVQQQLPRQPAQSIRPLDDLEGSADAAAAASVQGSGPINVDEWSDTRIARQKREKPTTLTPQQMLSIVLHQRGFTGKQRTGGEIGHGVDTHAMAQLLDADGNAIAHELGAHLTGEKAVEASAREVVPQTAGERGKVHAERMTIGAIGKRIDKGELDPSVIRGGKLQLVVDQYPCPPDKKDCLGHLIRFAETHGLELEVFVPTRPKNVGAGEVTPKTASQTAFKGPAVPGAKGGLASTGSAQVKQIYPHGAKGLTPGSSQYLPDPDLPPPTRPGKSRKPTLKPKLKLGDLLPSPGAFFKGMVLEAAANLAFQVLAHEIGKRLTLPEGFTIDRHAFQRKELLESNKGKIDEDIKSILRSYSGTILNRQLRGQQSFAVINYLIREEPDNPMFKFKSAYLGAKYSANSFDDVQQKESSWIESQTPRGSSTTYTYWFSVPIAFPEEKVNEYVDEQAAILGEVSPGDIATARPTKRFAVLADHLSKRIDRIDRQLEKASPGDASKLMAERDRLLGLLGNVTPHEKHQKGLFAKAERDRKTRVLKEFREAQPPQLDPESQVAELLPGSGGSFQRPVEPVDFLSKFPTGDVALTNAGRVADVFEALRDELVADSESLRKSSDGGLLSAKEYKSQYRIYVAKRDGWQGHLTQSIAIFEKAGTQRFAGPLERLKALRAWLGQTDGNKLFEVASSPNRVARKQDQKDQTVVVIDQAPMVPIDGGPNILLAKGTAVVALSKPMGRPQFVKIRVVESGKPGWIQPRFISRKK